MSTILCGHVRPYDLCHECAHVYAIREERERQIVKPDCDGLCVYASEVLPGATGVAYPHPGCPLHDPGEVCGCGTPDRCLSPTHGQISMAGALTIRHRQARSAP